MAATVDASSTPYIVGILVSFIGGISAFVVRLLNRTLDASEKREGDARAETTKVREDARLERDGSRTEIVNVLRDMNREMETMSEAQLAQYQISDGLIRAVAELKGLPMPAIPPPAAPVRPVRNPQRREGGD